MDERMGEGVVELGTHSGFRFRVRRARPGDEAVLGTFFAQVTPEDLRFRFLTTVREVSHARLTEMVSGDQGRTDSFLALGEDGETVVAAAMLAADAADTRGEVAISIRPDYKLRGISWSLLEHLVSIAADKGLGTIESIEDRHNRAAISLAQEMGFAVEPIEDEPELVLVRKTLG